MYETQLLKKHNAYKMYMKSINAAIYYDNYIIQFYTDQK